MIINKREEDKRKKENRCHKVRDKPRRGKKFHRARSHLISVASGLGVGGLGLGDDNPLLVDGLEKRLDDGTVCDLSTLKKRDQPWFAFNQKRKLRTRKAGSWSQRMNRDLKAKYHEK